ncbi:hypothetical protein K1719_042466 [Acacia pycnantha]|nr:hypothetical protein K1719_042466 [Acacia pycnantha]
MLSLVFIGIRLEQQFGFLRIGVIYLISGFGGSVLSSLFLRNNISVDASGALFGLLGAMLSELLTNWTIYINKNQVKIQGLPIRSLDCLSCSAYCWVKYCVGDAIQEGEWVLVAKSFMLIKLF